MVLLIGMRVNRFWAVHHWGPVMYAMSIYFDMPAFGPAGATGQVPVEERVRHAAQRLAFRSGAGSGESAGESVGESVGAGTTEGTADGVDARADAPGVS
ncbi:hypothetical protein [Kitasatospora aureofaciens]|uniref:hypothetical protein n=1 Tax=Kitasatospora aureofaciens TaxID=1894 RepID=UPI0036F4958E